MRAEEIAMKGIRGRPEVFPRLGALVVAGVLLCCLGDAGAREPGAMEDLRFMATRGDRSTGSEGCEEAADYILGVFREAGLSNVSEQRFLAPVERVLEASMEVDGETVPLHPWGPNMVYLSRTPPEGLAGPLVYAKDGRWQRFNGFAVDGSIVLMDMRSSKNWLNAAVLGAKALIFVGDETARKHELEAKNIPTPLAFPRYWVDAETGSRLKELAEGGEGGHPAEVVVRSDARWEHRMARNCYGFIEGRSPELREELLVLEAFYDASSHIPGVAPGADEATSIAMLLRLARALSLNPPERSVLLMATVGNHQGLAGMRQLVWALRERSIWMKRQERALRDQRSDKDYLAELLEKDDIFALEDPEDRRRVWEVMVERAKDRADYLTRETRYRKALERTGWESDGVDDAGEIGDPKPYRKLAWRADMESLSPAEKGMVLDLLDGAREDLLRDREELALRREMVRSARRVRSAVALYRPVLYLSLNLSTRAPSCGLVEWGNTFPMRERVIKKLRGYRLGEILDDLSGEAAREAGVPNPWSPARGGNRFAADLTVLGALSSDIAAMADLPAVSLASVDSDRSLWSTPNDTLDRVDEEQLDRYARFLPPLIRRLADHPRLEDACEIGGFRGMASMEGQAKFIRQGELFPDQPAPGTVVSVMQGDTVFRTMVYRDGTFYIPTLPNRRVSIQKFILEPFGLDPRTGRVAWTADKVQTGKNNYRIKVKSKLASTALVMFHCRQTDVLGAFQPQKMRHLTKVKLLDAITEASPLRYWYSRVDGRDTMAITVLLERGVRFKLILSETLLDKDFFLLNSSKEWPEGRGFLVGEPASIPLAPFQVAKDLTFLMGERLRNLHRHGIVNRYLEGLYDASQKSLEEARASLSERVYHRFWENTVSAWGKLKVIYNEVESTQRDVLTGVMFFIALFVPFAYCLERYLFCFRGIYQQLTAFFVILVTTILAIRALHPAFQLTYNPMVVIVAFFIVGLSISVSWIIFMRFEREMQDLQGEMTGLRSRQVSGWQALAAGFTIGVSNMNRRKLRTALTCITLVILTFTVMSFTNVKSLRQTTDIRLARTAPYRGVLLRDPFWRALTWLTLEDMLARYHRPERSGEAGEEGRYGDEPRADVWPRAWIEPFDVSSRIVTRIHKEGEGDDSMPLEGVLGVGPNAPDYFRDCVVHGRWLEPGERDAVLLPVRLAESLGLDPARDVGAAVNLLGDVFRVAGFFDGDLLEARNDLDQNPLTPAYMEIGQGEELTETEIEAMQEGEEMVPATERFRYASANGTAILPYEACIAHGGSLKALVLLPRPEESPLRLAESLTSWLAFALFVGDEDGIFYHSASTTLRYQGASSLIVPILIVVFICLNTMVGHVHERRKEIGIYTSVGLAPTHVGFLFIVEALSLAVLSTVVGYIVAQLSAAFMGQSSLFSQLTFNYSSLSSIACMFLVFSVVFLASLYPARMAAEIAMPDVNRSWTLPDPSGDALFLHLPFLLKYREEGGVMGFLEDFFDSHRDIAHGRFTVDDTALNVESPMVDEDRMPDPVCLLLRTNVWLAPFDFGIKQRLQLHCCPSEDNPGYLEIALQMIRLSGERSAWIRANKGFIQALRKQMLLWRILDESSKASYSAKAPDVPRAVGEWGEELPA